MPSSGLGDPRGDDELLDGDDRASDPDQPADRGHAEGRALCRPSEIVLDLLDAPLPQDFVKEDGERVQNLEILTTRARHQRRAPAVDRRTCSAADGFTQAGKPGSPSVRRDPAA